MDEVALCNFSSNISEGLSDVKMATEAGSRARRTNSLLPALLARKKLEKVKQDTVAQKRGGKETRECVMRGKGFPLTVNKNGSDPGLSLRFPIRLEGKKVLFIESP